MSLTATEVLDCLKAKLTSTSRVLRLVDVLQCNIVPVDSEKIKKCLEPEEIAMTIIYYAVRRRDQEWKRVVRFLSKAEPTAFSRTEVIQKVRVWLLVKKEKYSQEMLYYNYCALRRKYKRFVCSAVEKQTGITVEGIARLLIPTKCIEITNSRVWMGDVTCFCNVLKRPENTDQEVTGVACSQQTSLCSNNMIIADVTSISDSAVDINLEIDLLPVSTIADIVDIEDEIPTVIKEGMHLLTGENSVEPEEDVEAAPQTCIYCKGVIDLGERKSFNILTKRGAEGFNKYLGVMGKDFRAAENDYIHVAPCRAISRYSLKQVAEKYRDEARQEVLTKAVTRLQSVEFDIRTHCLFRGDPISNHPRDKSHEIMTFEFEQEVKQVIAARDDTWALEVKQRMESAPGYDLVANESKYHNGCRRDFMESCPDSEGDTRSGDKRPAHLSSSWVGPSSKRGPKVDCDKFDAFMFAISELEESETGIMKVGELIDLMATKTEDPYSYRYTVTLLNDQQFSDIVTTELGVVTLRDKRAKILREFLKNSKENDDTTRIIKATAKIISEDIRKCTLFSRSDPSYPDLTKFDAETMMQDLPETLLVLLKELIRTKVKHESKIISIAHAIMQAHRPGTLLMPLQLGAGLQMRHHFHSRYLIDFANAMGWCLSYATILEFEKCAAVSQSEHFSLQISNSFIQYVADNFDHNVITLDGLNTLHIMGILGLLTPGRPGSFGAVNLKKRKVTSAELAKLSSEIDYCSIAKSRHFFNIKFKSVVKEFEKGSDMFEQIHWKWADQLYVAAWSLGLHDALWRGTMQAINTGEHPGVSSVHFLPMIDLDPTDINCVYTTLKFVQRQCELQKCIPVLTFDQPLYLKALSLITAENSDVGNIFVRLGKFHLMLCWLSALGTLYSNSGLSTILEQCYGPLAVEAILRGKAFSRAVRAHSLVHVALYNELLGNLEDVLGDEDLKLLRSLHDLAITDLDPEEFLERFNELENSGLSEKIDGYIKSEKNNLQDSPTAVFWLQYLEMVELFFGLYRAERTGDIDLTIAVCKRMLPFLGAAGKNLYLESLWLDIQITAGLKDSHPKLLDYFKKNGQHAPRRKDRYWGAISLDQVIEQDLMRAMKTAGGPVRAGQSGDIAARNTWLYSRPVTAQISGALEKLLGVQHETGDQHAEASPSRRSIDHKDFLKLREFVQQLQPFPASSQSLRNIVTGVEFPATVNVHKAKEVGSLIVDKMVDIPYTKFKFSRKNQAVTMKSVTITTKEGKISIPDPDLLFQRFLSSVLLEKNKTLTIESLLTHELCPYAPALFDSPELLKTANKADLASSIIELFIPETTSFSFSTEQQIDVVSVVDGGMLVQKVKWRVGSIFADICSEYTRYITTLSSGREITIVFDGYKEHSTKDMTHRRRKRHNCADIFPDLDKQLTVKKDQFLSNSDNKQRFIDMLVKVLRDSGITCIRSEADADLDICKAALEQAEFHPVVLHGEDTDLLVILLHYASRQATNYQIVLKTRSQEWDIQSAITALPSYVREYILFIHTFLGCDTTSHILGQGKSKLLKIPPAKWAIEAEGFYRVDANKKDIIKAGETILLNLMKSSCGSLDEARVQTFHSKATTNMVGLKCSTLPPTSTAFEEHSLRTYLEVQGLCGNKLNPVDWGWKKENDEYKPVISRLPYAPKELTSSIKCQCKTTCTGKCTCRKAGIQCGFACHKCESTCQNR